MYNISLIIFWFIYFRMIIYLLSILGTHEIKRCILVNNPTSHTSTQFLVFLCLFSARKANEYIFQISFDIKGEHDNLILFSEHGFHIFQ